MGNQHQPFLWFDPNGQGLVGAPKWIRRHHLQHGSAVGGGDSEGQRDRWSVELISQDGMGLSEYPR